jgi:hypothetical protein
MSTPHPVSSPTAMRPKLTSAVATPRSGHDSASLASPAGAGLLPPVPQMRQPICPASVESLGFYLRVACAAYCESLIALARDCADQAGINAHDMIDSIEDRMGEIATICERDFQSKADEMREWM